MQVVRKITNVVVTLLVAGAVTLLVASAARSPIVDKRPEPDVSHHHGGSIVQKIDRFFGERWKAVAVNPATAADDLTVLRRLSLVLHGTVPSLEEIRLFESDVQPDRLHRWIDRVLADRRFADYFARRFSRVFVGTDEGPFVVFRRDRFWAWLSDQFHENRRYDEIVREMIAGRGLWTDKPQVNFVAVAANEGSVDVNKLAGRTARAFLGQRIDCAQCHNHPFAEWKQDQFEGLAACFGKVSLSIVGVEDNRKMPYTGVDRMTSVENPISPSVPFHSEWMPEHGGARERLAQWVTSEENRRFDRAIVNRIWGLMFGKPWISPVDDLPNPGESGFDPSDLLDLLAEDFRDHHRDLKRLIAGIASSRVFQLQSEHSALDSESVTSELESSWAVFPVTRLRPEQVIGSMLQASSIKTLDQNSHWTIRAVRFFRELDFVKEYGDLGEDELTERSGTIPQALLRMNSQFAAEWTKGTIFSAAGRLSNMADGDDSLLDLCFLVCLTRHPTDQERSEFKSRFLGLQRDQRNEATEDLFWSLFNSPEFCWEH